MWGVREWIWNVTGVPEMCLHNPAVTGGCQAGARVSLHAASVIVRASLCLQV